MNHAEDREQNAIRHTAAIVGFHVYDFSQGYRHERGGTRQTPGIPDLYLVHAVDPVVLWWETKTPPSLAEHYALAKYASAPLDWSKEKVRKWRPGARPGRLSRPR